MKEKFKFRDVLTPLSSKGETPFELINNSRDESRRYIILYLVSCG